MKKLLLVVSVLLFTTVVMAAVHNVSWTKATTNVDGSAIPATGAGSVSTTAEYGTCNGDAFGTKIADVATASTGLSAATPNLAPSTPTRTASILTGLRSSNTSRRLRSRILRRVFQCSSCCPCGTGYCVTQLDQARMPTAEGVVE